MCVTSKWVLVSKIEDVKTVDSTHSISTVKVEYSVGFKFVHCKSLTHFIHTHCLWNALSIDTIIGKRITSIYKNIFFMFYLIIFAAENDN